jgi:hypothetical protein
LLRGTVAFLAALGELAGKDRSTLRSCHSWPRTCMFL